MEGTQSVLFVNVQIPMILQEGRFMIISELNVHTLFDPDFI